MKRQVTCLDCGRVAGMKGMYKLPDKSGYMCWLCRRRIGSQRTITEINRQVKVARRRRAFSNEEERVLWKLYQNRKISYPEAKERLQALKSNVMSNNNLEYLKDKNKPKESFTSQFRKLKGGG